MPWDGVDDPIRVVMHLEASEPMGSVNVAEARGLTVFLI
jgi:hypothetical protein